MLTKLIFVLALTTLAHADDFSLQEEDVYGEPRLLDSVFNNTSIDLNSILALVLIGILFLVTQGGTGGLFGGSAYNRNSYQSYDYSDYGGYGDNQFYKRSSGIDNDMASKLAQLENAFKKYQVEEAECEMYIACEASQVHRHEENGPLAKIVYDILSQFNRAKDSAKWDDRVNGLVQAFEYGTGAYYAGQQDACQPLRNKCFELHSKKNY
jgi:hypothetical protein